MGYLSNGVVAIDKSVLKTFSIMGEVPSLFNDCNVYHTDKAVYFTYEDWKMYPHYSDVAEFLDFLDKLENSEKHQELFAYVQAGEEPEDFTLRGEVDKYGLAAGTETPEGYDPDDDDCNEYPFAYAGMYSDLEVKPVENYLVCLKDHSLQEKTNEPEDLP